MLLDPHTDTSSPSKITHLPPDLVLVSLRFVPLQHGTNGALLLVKQIIRLK